MRSRCEFVMLYCCTIVLSFCCLLCFETKQNINKNKQKQLIRRFFLFFQKNTNKQLKITLIVFSFFVFTFRFIFLLRSHSQFKLRKKGDANAAFFRHRYFVFFDHFFPLPTASPQHRTSTKLRMYCVQA